MGEIVFSDGTKVSAIPPLELNSTIMDDKNLLPTAVINPPQEVTFEADLHFNPSTLWYILTGMTITNNYLKYHGGVLQRHRQIRKLSSKISDKNKRK